MTIEDFWTIIDQARGAADGNDDDLLDELRSRLAKLPPAEIISFDVLYDALRFRAYRHELWGAAYLMNGGCSDDGFEYFRAWLISRGRKVYEAAMKDPDSLAAHVDTESMCHELEDFMRVADDAHEARTGKPMPNRKRDFPELTGQKWEEDQLESLYPKLWAATTGDEES